MSDARFIRSAAAAVAVLMGFAIRASGANLVNNPIFTGGISPWQGSTGSIAAFDPRDAAGSNSSGSLKLTTILPSGSVSAVGQCIAIDPAVHYRFRADVLFPTGQSAGDAEAYLYRFPTSNCTGAPLENGFSLNLVNFVGPNDDWRHVRNGNAFIADSATHSIQLWLGLYRTTGDTAPISAYFDNVVFEAGDATGTCVPNNQSLCLSDFRFQVYANFHTASGQGEAHSLQLTDDSGVFTFFDAGNIEVQLKVLNTCSFSNRFWFFASGTTNVGVDITVVDTKTAATKTYSNALNHAFTPILDTNAFATCP